MQSADYQRRLEAVQAAMRETRIAKERPPRRMPLQILGSVAGAAALFFVLKAAALAYSGLPFAAAPGAEASLAVQIHHWFAGADPITRTLAAALGPASQASL